MLQGAGIFDSIVKSLPGLARVATKVFQGVKKAAPYIKRGFEVIKGPAAKIIAAIKSEEGQKTRKALEETFGTIRKGLETAKTGVDVFKPIASTALELAREPGQRQRAEQQAARERQHTIEDERRQRELDLEFQRREAEQDLALEQQRRKAMMEEERTAAEERRARSSQYALSLTQSRDQAATFLRSLKSRYPQVFSRFPQYEALVLNKVTEALTNQDTEDPFYAQKAMGELEYEIAQIQSQIHDTGTPMTYVPEPYQGRQRSIADYAPRTAPRAPTRGQTGSVHARPKDRPRKGRMGGGLSTVMCP